jgi:hypothetical protein
MVTKGDVVHLSIGNAAINKALLFMKYNPTHSIHKG